MTNFLTQQLTQLQTAFASEPYPDFAARKDRLQRLKKSLKLHYLQLVQAMSEDFGSRSRQESLLADVLPILSEIDFVSRRLKRWMRPEKRQVDWLYQPAQARVIYQPVGVVGIMVPWNYPLQLALSPLVSALAAGNRAFLKLSEWTPATNQALITCLQEAFTADEVQIATGKKDVSQAFAQLPLDHLLFTGSSAVGRHIQRAVAENLTPVTLELGGKSPALLDEGIALKQALDPLLFGKTLNAGQTCIAPDYLLCPEERLDEVIAYLQKRFTEFFPQLKDNPDYTSLINRQHKQRLQDLLQEAQACGCQTHELNPAKEDLSDGNKLALTLVINPDSEARMMQEELFGPLLPIITYRDFSEAIQFIRQRPRPLALYYLGKNPAHQQLVEYQTLSGGLAINETLLQVAQHDLPFGGVGASGMGHYHGREGFLTFSKAKGVFQRRLFNSARLIYPPYGRWIHRLLERWFMR
ncbi:coniferyl-aldehyde dehydrogenase [Marinospirillum celere]|uniref:Aldehyde dehydrogenase n=1 Tax=Marinospirillum celere TaxID=1122252 RepID=A0A1I1HV36_9GAMM|nr:coniferyl aldehyde dehydrogenase [Marinospirillum celere]SFC27794.1 coniferyl-aldehyde dehydrogenase [Marinospirillum celere]